ncbi:hypothetical protein Tco_0571930, partial [Tanacetum coccineum]
MMMRRILRRIPWSSPLTQVPSPLLPLPLPSPLPTSPTYLEAPLGLRAAEIRQREALLSPLHDTEILDIDLPL